MAQVTVGRERTAVVLLRIKPKMRFFQVHPFVEAFNAEHGTHLRVISHTTADELVRRAIDLGDPSGFGVDSVIAYEAPDVAFGSKVVFSMQDQPRVVLATGKYRGERNAALVVHGVSCNDVLLDIREVGLRTQQELLASGGIDFLLALNLRQLKGIELLVPDSRLILVSRFPPLTFGADNSFYRMHPEASIPCGDEVPRYSDGARYLGRLSSAQVTYILRTFDFYDLIGTDSWPSGLRSVVAEVPREDYSKISSLLSVV